jgi:hypothetical protein
MFPVRYELRFYIPEDGIVHSHCHENLRCYIWSRKCCGKGLAVSLGPQYHMHWAAIAFVCPTELPAQRNLLLRGRWRGGGIRQARGSSWKVGMYGPTTSQYLPVACRSISTHDSVLKHSSCETDHDYGLVVRVTDYRSRGSGLGSWRYQTSWELLGLEWGPLSLVMIIEGLSVREISGSGLENRE